VQVTIQTDNPHQHEGAEQVVVGSPLPGMTEDEFAALARKILVCVPYRSAEGVHPGICMHWGMWGRFGLRMATIKDPHGGFIEIVRAGIVRTFLDYRKQVPEVEYLIMIDNDQGIEWDAPWRLARHALPVVTGVVCGYTEEKGIFACFTVKNPSGAAYFPTMKHTTIMPSEGVVEVHQCGTGLLCIHHSVLDQFAACNEIPFYIPEEIRRESATTGDLRRSEDICFADLCEKYGIKRYADLSVQAVHYKNIGLAWPHDKLVSMPVAEWIVQPHDGT
jgi:hypothetical protein